MSNTEMQKSIKRNSPINIEWFNMWCCIFRPAFGCCALQTLVEIVIFSVFAAKNLKKARILQQISVKNTSSPHHPTLHPCTMPWTNPCINPCTAQHARQPQPHFNTTWHGTIGTTWYCCYNSCILIINKQKWPFCYLKIFFKIWVFLNT